ncbi:hypothetical protein [uncultured Kordia sp.]|uniref:hypothetical protein n=1 Tax=uncultured Kordia sp. TaxID=507699 RepID=UPI00260404B7|nr:hypothetical protein [uncultured Kordia sp.]
MKEGIVISQGNRPLWQNLIAAICYAASLTAIFLLFYNYTNTYEKGYFKIGATYIEIAIYAIGPALYYSILQSYHFDFKNSLYKHEYTFLIFKKGKWKPLPALEYISVFKREMHLYEVNLWCAGNKHFKIYRLSNEQEALKVGKQFAKRLQLDLLDATVANDSKWIDV